MNDKYVLAETIIIIEFALAGLLIVAAYLLKLYYYIKERRHQYFTRMIEDFFNKLIASGQTVDFVIFPDKWRKLNMLFPILEKLDKNNNGSPAWGKLREKFINEILAPLARNESTNLNWALRFYASQVFAFVSQSTDESYVIQLANDKVPLVHLHALSAALNLCSEKAINIIIDRMLDQNWLTLSIYLQAFDSAPPDTYDIIERRLVSATDSKLRTACYNILLHYPNKRITWDISNDIQLDNKYPTIAALKFLVEVKKEAAISVLVEQLQNKHWEVRIISLHRLGLLQATEAKFAIVQCLYDSDWWVKMSAAEVLKSFGAEGQGLLKENIPELEKIPFDVREHIINTLW